MSEYCSHASAVPVHTGNVWWRWCHYCFTWHVSAWQGSQTDDERLALTFNRQTECGPFDGPAEVLGIVNEWAAAALHAPGVPWDLRS